MHSLGSGLQLEERSGRTGASINHHTEGNQMPRNKPDLKVVDDGNQESGRKSRGPAVNRVTLVGRLASDPELHYTPSGSAVTQLRLATKRRRGARVPQPECLGQAGRVRRQLPQEGTPRLFRGPAALVDLEGLGRQHAAQLR